MSTSIGISPIFFYLQLELQDWIRGNVSECKQSLFIFDEIDKMEEGIIEAIKPFIDADETVQGVDFRKSIFIFLSNTGGQLIANKVTGRFTWVSDIEIILA